MNDLIFFRSLMHLRPFVSLIDMAGRALNPPICSLLATSDPAEHARRRRPWTRAFSTAALKEYHPIIHKHVTQLTELLANSCSAHVKSDSKVTEADKNSWTNLTQWIAFFTYDFMGDMVLVFILP